MKIDIVVGSGIGAVTAAYAAVGGGSRSSTARAASGTASAGAPSTGSGPPSVSPSPSSACRSRSSRSPCSSACCSGSCSRSCSSPTASRPGVASRALALLWVAPEALSGPYLAAQAVPVFALAMLAIAAVAVVYFRDRRRFPEAFESFLDAEPGLARLRRGLWEIARGAALSGGPPSEAELGRRYVALLAENLGEPGFRELVLRAADLDRGDALVFAAPAGRRERRLPRARGRPRGRGGPPRAGSRRALLRRAGHRAPLPDGDADAPGGLPEGGRPRAARPTG